MINNNQNGIVHSRLTQTKGEPRNLPAPRQPIRPGGYSLSHPLA